MYKVILTLFMALIASAAPAQDSALFDIGNDAFRAGQTVEHSQTGIDDLFMAGETVTSAGDITGSAHMAGRWITLEGAVGGDAYAAGQRVVLEGDVAGDASLAGQEIQSRGAVGGDLRLAGSMLEIGGDVAGYAIVAGERLDLDAVITGDLAMAVREVRFGRAAQVGGTLILYEPEPGQIDVPASVAPEERITRRKIEEWDDDFGRYEVFSWRRAIGSFLSGVLVVAILAALIAALAPSQMADMRRRVLEAPGRTFTIGFLAQSALVGASIIVAMTIIGIVLTPLIVVLALLAGFFGYVIGAYAVGVGLLSVAGRSEPDSTGDRALAAAVGALVVGILGLVPFLGWLFVLALVLAGVGAITIRLFRPAFFTAT